jgi:hypothetical protein
MSRQRARPMAVSWAQVSLTGCSPSTTIARQANALLFFTFFDP